MKRRILCGWEFGAGNGHVVLLREIIRSLSPEEFDFKFALRNPASGIAVGLDPSKIIATPIDPLASAAATRPKPVPRATYGEFVCEAILGPGRDPHKRLSGWDRLIADFKPHAIIADYAPALAMVGRGRVPVIATGTGYSLPPPEMSGYPPLVTERLPRFAAEADLVERLNVHLRAAGASLIERLPQLTEADAYGLFTIPLFDPYAEHRSTAPLGIDHPGGSPRPAKPAAGLIAYMDETWQLDEEFTGGLIDSGVAGEAHLGPPLRRTRKKFAATEVVISDRLFNLASAMPGKAVAIHMGTLGFASAAALAGVPQIVLYKNQENMLIGEAVRREGAAVTLPRNKLSAEWLAETVRKVATDSAMRTAAIELAGRLAPYCDCQATVKVAAMVRRLAG